MNQLRFTGIELENDKWTKRLPKEEVVAKFI